MALVEWLLPSMWVEPPTSSRWMAAQQLSIVLVKAQSGKYKHDDHNDQRQNLVICHYATSFVQDVRKGGEKPGAISQPCLAAKPPFLPGVTPHGHFNMRKTILSTATAPRRPPFYLPERAKHRNSARRQALRAPVSLGRRRETGTAAQVVALRASRQGRCKRQNRRASAKGTVSHAAAVFRPYGLRRTASSSGGLFFWFM